MKWLKSLLFNRKLLAAARAGNAKVVRRLVSWGADKNARATWRGPTLLHEAAWKGHAAVVEVLVQAGAEIEAKEDDGQTPLQTAAQQGHAAVVEVLVRAGADIKAKDRWGSDALHLGAYSGHAPVVEVLLRAGADIEAKGGPLDRTPLQTAAKRGHAAVVEVLIEAGADREIVDSISKALWELSDDASARLSVVKILHKASPQSPAQNLLWWERSGLPRRWVRDHHGKWAQSDLPGLLGDARATDFWPMDTDAIGALLEKHKKEYERDAHNSHRYRASKAREEQAQSEAASSNITPVTGTISAGAETSAAKRVAENPKVSNAREAQKATHEKVLEELKNSEVIRYAKSRWVTADVMLVSFAKRLGYSTTPSPSSYEGILIKFGICVSNLTTQYSALSERDAMELMIAVLEDWRQIDKATGSRLRKEH